MESKLALNTDRINKIKSTTWVGYDRAVLIRGQMDELISHPKIHRMPNLALIAESNNGKTMLLKNFCKKHNPPNDPNAEKIILPALMIQTPPSADEGRLYYEILDSFGAAGAIREPEVSKLRRMKIILRNLETRVLILDDFFNIGSSSPAKRRSFLNALRNLGITLEIPIIVSGTHETLNILSIDRSIANRFKPLFLPKWTLERSIELAKLVVSVLSTLEIKISPELDENHLKKLLFLSEGLLGEMVAVLKLLAEDCIKKDRSSIDHSSLTLQNLTSLGWVMPSDRSRHIE